MSEQDEIIREKESGDEREAQLDQPEWSEGEGGDEPLPRDPSEVQT